MLRRLAPVIEALAARCGEAAGQEWRGGQNAANHAERGAIGRRDFVEERPHDARQAEGAGGANCNSSRRNRHSLLHYHSHHFASTRAERHPHADLVRALGDQGCGPEGHTEETHLGKDGESSGQEGCEEVGSGDSSTHSGGGSGIDAGSRGVAGSGWASS